MRGGASPPGQDGDEEHPPVAVVEDGPRGPLRSGGSFNVVNPPLTEAYPATGGAPGAPPVSG